MSSPNRSSSSDHLSTKSATSAITSTQDEVPGNKDEGKDNTRLIHRDVNKLTDEMFGKVAEYLRAEMLATTEDYKLLETMNNVTRERYKEMSAMAQQLMIDEICEQVDYLGKVTAELDEYSKHLELRLKKVSK
ncbi:3319_t:CDS:2 [Paraglomus occultum]|uniref:3319_t:CDS:1 n=1 Tax=Paraglomus occultum TaxID=144539 RepID=A0A9N8ZDB1_9GLOM|nr:3319_t:CDS:2 [Paraglomus occultum]